MLLVLFEIKNRRYGIEAKLVKEIIPLLKAQDTEFPSEYCYGTVILRGQPLHVVDLVKILFKTPAATTLLSTRIIVVQLPFFVQPIGFVAEKILQTAQVNLPVSLPRENNDLLQTGREDRPAGDEGINIVDENFLMNIIFTAETLGTSHSSCFSRHEH